MNGTKVFQIGCGRMSKYIMKYVYDLGGTIVGAVDVDPDKLGEDIGTIIGTEPKNIFVFDTSKLEYLLNDTKPDIAVITTLSYLNDVENTIRTCVRCGVNVITTSEECFFASNSNPTLFHELDVLAVLHKL